MRGLDVAATGMIAAQNQVDNIANNLANANTTAFKRGNAAFVDLIYLDEARALGPVSSVGGDAIMTPVGIQFGSGARLQSISKDFSQGGLEKTSGELDVAIQGTGFFAIELPDGTTAYTRDGHFKIDPNTNQLVTMQGYVLNPGITVPQNQTALVIKRDGTVTAEIPGQVDAQELGNIQLTTFSNLPGLSAIGDNLFAETSASGPPNTGTPQQLSFGSLMQGWLETANVNAVIEITDLIKAQRNYEMNSTVIKTEDNMLKDVVTLHVA